MSTAPQSGKQQPCIGIVASDPLRSIGLQSILEDGLNVQTTILPDESRPRSQKINVLIIDQPFEDPSGSMVPLNRSLLHMPGVAVVILVRGGVPPVSQLLAAGVRGVLFDTAQVHEIRACIRSVLKGKTWVPREQARDEEKPEDSRSAATRVTYRFTPKEREVMHWLAQGQSNREIAATMKIDEATVKAHLGRMLRKADASNRVELTLRALAVQPTL